MENLHSSFVFGRSEVHISTGIPVVLAQIFMSLPSLLNLLFTNHPLVLRL
jgi:hypothetical protein